VVEAGADQGSACRVLVEQADGPVLVQPLGIAGGLGELRRQGGQPRPDERDGVCRVALPDLVDRVVHGGQLLAGGLLQLVDQDQGADPEVAGRLAEDLEQRGEVVGEAAAVGDAVDQVDVGAQAERAGRRVELDGERLEDAEQRTQPGLGVPPGGGPHRLHEGLAERHRQRGARRGLHLGRDPALAGHLGQQLVEQHGLADATQAVEDPAPVALAVLLGLAPDDVEGSEDRLPAGQHGRTSTRAGPVGVRHRVHV
jgi:hypothetical protein